MERMCWGACAKLGRVDLDVLAAATAVQARVYLSFPHHRGSAVRIRDEGIHPLAQPYASPPAGPFC
jgi:hypothetical protein